MNGEGGASAHPTSVIDIRATCRDHLVQPFFTGDDPLVAQMPGNDSEELADSVGLGCFEQPYLFSIRHVHGYVVTGYFVRLARCALIAEAGDNRCLNTDDLLHRYLIPLQSQQAAAFENNVT